MSKRDAEGTILIPGLTVFVTALFLSTVSLAVLADPPASTGYELSGVDDAVPPASDMASPNGAETVSFGLQPACGGEGSFADAMSVEVGKLAMAQSGEQSVMSNVEYDTVKKGNMK